jgi:hypothetical protein
MPPRGLEIGSMCEFSDRIRMNEFVQTARGEDREGRRSSGMTGSWSTTLRRRCSTRAHVAQQTHSPVIGLFMIEVEVGQHVDGSPFEGPAEGDHLA